MTVLRHQLLVRISAFALLFFALLGRPAVWADLFPATSEQTTANLASPSASNVNFEFSLNKTKWDPGENTASVHGHVPGDGGPMTPGGATWSVMPANTVNGTYDDHGHGTAQLSTDVGSLLSGAGAGTELTIFADALNMWASVSGFSNLGQRADNGGLVGLLDNSPGNTMFGDIRIGAYSFTGSILAHGYEPGTEAIFSEAQSLGGDVHFDTDRTWLDIDAEQNSTNSNLDGYDLFTVALHEFGHALGLEHNTTNPLSIMYTTIDIGTMKRSLHADDIAGIQALYGMAAVPEPSSFLYLGLLASGVMMRRRKRRTAQQMIAA